MNIEHHILSWTRLEALEPWEREKAAGRVPSRGAAVARGAEVHPRGAAVHPGGPTTSARDGVRHHHAQQLLHHAVDAHRADIHRRSRPRRRRALEAEHGSRGCHDPKACLICYYVSL